MKKVLHDWEGDTCIKCGVIRVNKPNINIKMNNFKYYMNGKLLDKRPDCTFIKVTKIIKTRAK